MISEILERGGSGADVLGVGVFGADGLVLMCLGWLFLVQMFLMRASLV